MLLRVLGCTFFCLSVITAKTQVQKAFGAQIGFSYAGADRLEAGANYYFSRATGKDNTHTFGPHCSLTGIFANKNYYIGQQIGVNYHFTEGKYGFAFRVSPAFENNFNHDMRLGSDFGISYLGMFIYGGYYTPVASFESPYITRWRFGVRFILNGAPIRSIGFE